MPIMYAALDNVSRELVGLIPAVSRNSTFDSVAKGQIVNVPVTDAATAADITPGVTAPATGDESPDNVSVTISKSRQAPVRWNGEETRQVVSTGIMPNVNQQRFEQAMRTLTNEVETDLAALHITASRAFGTAGTTPFGTINELDDFSKTQQILNDNGAPADRTFVMGTGALANAQGYQPGLIYANTANSNALRTGVIGDVFSMGLGTSGQIASFTKGAMASATTTAVALTVGQTAIPVATAGTGVVSAGDIITIAADANKYVVKSVVFAGANPAAGDIITIAEPGIQQALGAVATAITVVATSVRNMCFSRSAIALALAMPAMPEGGDMADDVTVITDPVSGLSFQVAQYKQYRQVHYEVGLNWGVKTIQPRHLAICLG